MKSFCAVLAACFSLLCTVLLVVSVLHFEVSGPMVFAATVSACISHAFWSSRPNAWRWHYNRKVLRRYWYVPTKSLQKFLLVRYQQKLKDRGSPGGHIGFAIWVEMQVINLDLQGLR